MGSESPSYGSGCDEFSTETCPFWVNIISSFSSPSEAAVSRCIIVPCLPVSLTGEDCARRGSQGLGGSSDCTLIPSWEGGTQGTC